MRHILLVTSMLVMFPLICRGSDHIDFLGGENHKIPRHADLSDLYSWVSEDGKLVLALNTYMHPAKVELAPEFDGSVEYRFDIRKVELRKPTEIKVTAAIAETETGNSNKSATTRKSSLRVPKVQEDFSANVTCRPVGNLPNLCRECHRLWSGKDKKYRPCCCRKKSRFFYPRWNLGKEHDEKGY